MSEPTEPTTDVDPTEKTALAEEASKVARWEHLRELLSTWVAEFSVLIAVFPLLDYIMAERGSDTTIKRLVALLSFPVALAFLALAAYIRVGSFPHWLLRSKQKRN